MIDLGIVRPGTTIRIPFSTFDKDDGSASAATNYAAADILVFKGGSTTERASTAGYTATADFDTLTGKNLAIIDLSDNTDAGFYAGGGEYLVAINAITVDGISTGGWIARFIIGYRDALYNTTIASINSQTSIVLSAGPAEDNALNGRELIIHDVASGVQFSSAIVTGYTGASKTCVLAAAPTFTVAATDNVSVMGLAPLQATTPGSALTVTSGRANADVVAISTDTTAADNLEAAYDGAGYAGGTIPQQVALTTSGVNAIADQVWDEDMTGHLTANSAGIMLQPIRSANCQAGGSTTTIVLDASASSTDDYYNNMLIEIFVAADGTNKISRFIDDYDQATKTCTVATMPFSPGATYRYVVKGFGAIAGATAPTASDNAAAVWNAARASYVAAGSMGQAVAGEISHAGTAQGGTTSSVTLAAAAESSTNNLYRYHQVEIVGGTGAGQVSYATGYTAASRVLAVDPAFAVAPDSTSVVVLRKAGLDAATPAIVADAVWDEARSGHATAGSFGEYVFADMVRISSDATAADNAESFFDGTGYAGTGNTIPTVTTVTNQVTANVTAISGDTTAADNLEAAADGTGYNLGGGAVVAASVTGNVGGNVTGNVTGSVGSVTTVSDKTGYSLSTAGIDALYTRALTESYAADGAAPTVAQALCLIQQALTEFAITSTSLVVKKLDGTTTAATMTLNDGTAPTSITRAS
jgi:hypothetical protein